MRNKNTLTNLQTVGAFKNTLTRLVQVFTFETNDLFLNFDEGVSYVNTLWRIRPTSKFPTVLVLI